MRQLSSADVHELFEAFKSRRNLFPAEEELMSFGVVLMNYGDKFTNVRCVNGEWHGVKMDVPKNPGIPKCPNNHVLLEYGERTTLGLIPES